MLDKIKALADSCPCGAKHALSTAVVDVSPDATAHLLEFIRRYNHPAVVCDVNTKKFASRLGQTVITLDGNIHADENTTAHLAAIPECAAADALIACGSGSLHDTVRYVAHEKGIPFISYPTAASVDGFVSSVAAMTWHSQKLTFPSSSPVAVFADDAVFTDAPKKLLASGIGDMLGKITALFDWRAASVLIGESLCEGIFAAEKEALKLTISAVENGADSRDCCHIVMEALILSGLAMQLCGNSRPASGAEHHLSHLWEMHVVNGETPALHGEKVGVGTLLAVNAYKNSPLPERIAPLCEVFDREMLSRSFGGLTDGIIKENLPDGSLSSSSLASLSLTEDNLESVAQLVRELPDVERILDILLKSGGICRISSLGLPDDRSFVETSLRLAPYVRNRLTLLKVLSAAGGVLYH